MTDLINQLRVTASKGISVWGDLQMEAANQIDALTAERDELATTLAAIEIKVDALIVERRAISEGWDTANKLALQNALERDALKDAARLALDFVEFCWRDVTLNEFAEEKRATTEAALKAVL